MILITHLMMIPIRKSNNLQIIHKNYQIRLRSQREKRAGLHFRKNTTAPRQLKIAARVSLLFGKMIIFNHRLSL